MITGRVKTLYGLSRHDLLVITCCRSMELCIPWKMTMSWTGVSQPRD